MLNKMSEIEILTRKLAFCCIILHKQRQQQTDTQCQLCLCVSDGKRICDSVCHSSVSRPGGVSLTLPLQITNRAFIRFCSALVCCT